MKKAIKSSEPSNAITQRLEKMNQLWERFRSFPKARVCRWLVHQDEKQMINAFLETSYLEDNPVLDFFIPFYAECTNSKYYSHELIEELREKVESDREAMEAEGISISWTPKAFQYEQGQEVSYFLDSLYNFSQEAPSGELLVAVLMPDLINVPFIRWLTGILDTGTPENLRLLLIELIGEVKLDEVAAAYPELVKTASLELDMPGAMRLLASAGDPADQGVKFRKGFLELSQAAATKNLSEIQRLEVNPLVIAREQGWVPMEVAVHNLVASAYIGLNQLPNALRRYEQAYGVAKKAHVAGEQVALTLAVQCLFNKGSVFIVQKAFPEAAKAFALAATHAQEANDHFQVMEAKRMHGYCLEKCSEWAEAFRVEKEALAAAELLEDTIRLNSTLPYLGKALLDLAHKMGNKAEYLQLEDKLNALAGTGWQSKLQTAKATAV